MNVRTLLVDNHDSYTFNLFQLIADVNGVAPVVMTNDDPSLTRLPSGTFDNIVISPGPGRPQRVRDTGYVPSLLRRTDLPVLGVCLGHQVIAHGAGAEVGLAPQPRHGHLTTVRHLGDDLFAGVPPEFTAVRYHSLCVAEPLPDELLATAWAEDGVLMALRHRDLPRWGVQFHPESIASRYGREIAANFAGLTRAQRRRGEVARITVPRLAGTRKNGPGERLELISTAVRPAADSETMFRELFAASPASFWLDSSLVEPGLSRFSFLGDGSGPLSETLTYRAGTGRVRIQDGHGARMEEGNVFDVLDRRLQDRRLPDTDLPFDFTCGYVGYFGYELKADCGASNAHTAATPDAMWMFADRLVAVDHETRLCYVLAVHNGDSEVRAAAQGWVDRTARRLERLRPPGGQAGEPGDPAAAAPPAGQFSRDEDGYQSDIEECQRQLAQGESYEICLTTKLRLPFHDDVAAFYSRLRRANPAPYAALLRTADFTVFGSSPERFLRIERNGRVETKPIKGTAPRDADPDRDAQLARELATSPKTQAENLMIVDLLRSDLGQVCEIGSVTVERYLAVESYATVHQLVSTITGQLGPAVSPVECVRHCFPGGSMTGAPKLRTMEIIDRLETEARGIYAGTLGYFGLSGGADLNIVIRTAVLMGGELTIGAGGAIVLDSRPQEEYEEMLLKVAGPLRAYRPAALAGARR
jgi:para-aminobenzoate synthetase